MTLAVLMRVFFFFLEVICELIIKAYTNGNQKNINDMMATQKHIQVLLT